MKRNLYFICYDIRNPRRQKKAYELLTAYSSCKQYSCFECFLSKGEVEKLLEELRLILSDDDAFSLIKINRRGDIISIGQTAQVFTEKFTLVQ